jgi:hypothetical protein
MRHDFNMRTKDTLARRAGMRCSRPTCRQPTSGPHTEVEKSINIGVAAHIKAASSGGPRYDRRLSISQRKSITNGIWLCQNCAKLVDNDYSAFTAKELLRWKHLAERAARLDIERSRRTGTKKVVRSRVPSSVKELIALTDLRASVVLKEMDESKKAATELFEKQQPRHDKQSPSMSDLNKPLVMWDTLWRITSETELSLRLDSLRHSFLELHAMYKDELRRGHYVTAHEILGQIHSVIFKHRSICEPADAYFSFIMSMSCPLPPNWSRIVDRETEINRYYPGLIKTDLADRLPRGTSRYFLITGQERRNERKAINWALRNNQ